MSHAKNEALINSLWKAIDDDEHEIIRLSAELETARQYYQNLAYLTEKSIAELRKRSFDHYGQILRLTTEEL